MKVIEHRFPSVKSRTTTVKLYPLGDVHIGALNCAEKQFRRLVKEIEADPNAYWFGGGDYIDAIILQDQKRFDPNVLPDWMLASHKTDVCERVTKGGDPDAVASDIVSMLSRNSRKKLSDIVAAERDRFLDITRPIHSKCIGLLEGNHEYSIMKYHNRDIMNDMATTIGAPNLTDCAFIRLKFERAKQKTFSEVATVRLFAAHGNGGGRTPGAEPNHLARLANDKECELVLRGHSHTQCISPPIARLTIPKSGVLDEEADSTVCHVANWGCFVRTYAAGPSTYASRSTYPVRPLSTIRVTITPFRERYGRTRPLIVIEEVDMR
jgi:predicted phosphodiesterase